MATSLGFPLLIQGTLSVVNAIALLVGSTFNCQLGADRFLPASFILTPCWFPQEVKQPRSEESLRLQMPLELCSQAGKVFWMQQNLLQNGPFPECQHRATVAKGSGWGRPHLLIQLVLEE